MSHKHTQPYAQQSCEREVPQTGQFSDHPPWAPPGYSYTSQASSVPHDVQKRYTADGLVAAFCCWCIGGLCYMCAREQRYWKLVPAEAAQPAYHADVPVGAPSASAQQQYQPYQEQPPQFEQPKGGEHEPSNAQQAYVSAPPQAVMGVPAAAAAATAGGFLTP